MNQNKPSSKFQFIYISFVHQAFVLGLIFMSALLNLIACCYTRYLSLRVCLAQCCGCSSGADCGCRRNEKTLSSAVDAIENNNNNNNKTVFTCKPSHTGGPKCVRGERRESDVSTSTCSATTAAARLPPLTLSRLRTRRDASSQQALNLMLIASNVNDWSYGLTLALFMFPRISYIHILKASNLCQVLTHALNFFIFMLFHVEFRRAAFKLVQKVRVLASIEVFLFLFIIDNKIKILFKAILVQCYIEEIDRDFD